MWLHSKLWAPDGGEGKQLQQEQHVEGKYCTTFFQRLVRPVPAVSMWIAHFASVNALSTLTLKLAGTFTCWLCHVGQERKATKLGKAQDNKKPDTELQEGVISRNRMRLSKRLSMMRGTFQGVQSAWSAQPSLPSNPTARTAYSSLQEAACCGTEEQCRPPPSAALLQFYKTKHKERSAVLYIPWTQPASSLLSGQSCTLSHCFAPWMQVPSPHWNSSGLQVTRALKKHT